VAKKPKWTFDYPNAWNGGVLATAGGLVFQGALDGKFRAFDAATGEKKWEGDAQYPVMSGPISYEIDGEQYVAATAGWGTALPLAGGTGQRMGSAELGRVVVYKLGGKATLPEYELFPVDPVPAAEDFGSAQMVEHGKQLYFENCMVCHGDGAQSGGVVADLRWSGAGATKETWKAVVIDGQYATAGMASFTGAMSLDDVEAIRAYVVSRAHEDAAALAAAAPQ
jgi:quinohemoprotein ethanol dehydrogenase